jgi:hypothetical protein
VRNVSGLCRFRTLIALESKNSSIIFISVDSRRPVRDARDSRNAPPGASLCLVPATSAQCLLFEDRAKQLPPAHLFAERDAS